jgi:hypothetical protein
MNCQSIEDYLKIYLETDVLLLADCYEMFRSMSLRHFQLDPAKFISTPHLAFHAMLKMTEIEMDLFQDLEQYLFIKKGIRGGIASIVLRHVDKMNFPAMKEAFSSEMQRKEILALDATNHYGYALSQALPIGDYQWVTDVDHFDVMTRSYSSKMEKMGYILEVDLDYPKEIHDWHDDLPLAPEKLSVPPSDWSPYMHYLAGKYLDGTQIRSMSAEKFIPHLGPRHNYAIYYKNLVCYLKLGMKLKKIHRPRHRILSFRESAWMKENVMFMILMGES